MHILQDKNIRYILHRAAMACKCDFTNRLDEIGITPGQFMVLKEIHTHQIHTSDLGLAPAIIAARLEYDRPTISGILERLEAQGWVDRLTNPADKRSYLICVTEKAKEKLKELEEKSSDNRDNMVKGFSEEEIASFKNYLLRVINNMKSVDNK